MNELLTPVTEALGWTLLHFLWEGAVVGAIMLVILTTLRRASATVRYGTAVAGLIALAAAPIVTFGLVWEGPRDALPAGLIGLLTAAPAETVADRLAPLLPGLTTLWAIGVALLALRTFVRWSRARRWQREGTTPAPVRLRDTAERWRDRLGVRRAVTIVTSSLAPVPAVAGLLRPVILLPAAAITSLTPAQIEAIIVHELAHLRRYDDFVNTLQLIVEALLFFHPAVWWLSNRIRVEREYCCDDIVVARCSNAYEYATALFTLDELRDAGPALALASTGGHLMHRIERLVRPAAPAPRGGFAPLAPLAVAAGLAAAALAWTAPGSAPCPPDEDEARVIAPETTTTFERYMAGDAKSEAAVRNTRDEIMALREALAHLRRELHKVDPERAEAMLNDFQRQVDAHRRALKDGPGDRWRVQDPNRAARAELEAAIALEHAERGAHDPASDFLLRVQADGDHDGLLLRVAEGHAIDPALAEELHAHMLDRTDAAAQRHDLWIERNAAERAHVEELLHRERNAWFEHNADEHALERLHRAHGEWAFQHESEQADAVERLHHERNEWFKRNADEHAHALDRLHRAHGEEMERGDEEHLRALEEAHHRAMERLHRDHEAHMEHSEQEHRRALELLHRAHGEQMEHGEQEHRRALERLHRAIAEPAAPGELERHRDHLLRQELHDGMLQREELLEQMRRHDPFGAPEEGSAATIERLLAQQQRLERALAALGADPFDPRITGRDDLLAQQNAARDDLLAQRIEARDDLFAQQHHHEAALAEAMAHAEGLFERGHMEKAREAYERALALRGGTRPRESGSIDLARILHEGLMHSDQGEAVLQALRGDRTLRAVIEMVLDPEDPNTKRYELVIRPVRDETEAEEDPQVVEWKVEIDEDDDEAHEDEQ